MSLITSYCCFSLNKNFGRKRESLTNATIYIKKIKLCFGISNKSFNSTGVLLSAVSTCMNLALTYGGKMCPWKPTSLGDVAKGCFCRGLVQDSQVLTASPGWDQCKIHPAVTAWAEKSCHIPFVFSLWPEGLTQINWINDDTPVHLGSGTLWAKLMF